MTDTIAHRIRALREKRGWSKLELGRRIGVKNGHVAIHRWETGAVIPSPANVEKLASVFGVPKEEVDPTGSAYNLTGPRRKSHGVDNTIEADTIPPSLPTTTTEGQMRDQLRSLEGALSLVPEKHHARFILEVKRLAARMLLQEEDAGAAPVKQKHASGRG